MRGAWRAVVVAAIPAIAPAGAYAVDYLTEEQALRVIFPEADRFEPREFTLDATALQQLARQGPGARSVRWTLHAARRGAETLGYVVVDDVIGKFELITYAVGVTREGMVRQVEILSYRESHGHEVRMAAWRRQFVGKSASTPVRVGEDIANISGATLSCNHVTDGVRRILGVVEFARRSGLLS